MSKSAAARRSPSVRWLFVAAVAAIGAVGLIPSHEQSALAGAPNGAPEVTLGSTTYDVVHSFEVKDLPEGAKTVRMWFWMPEDRAEQKVLDFRIVSDAPTAGGLSGAGPRVTRDLSYGRNWVYAEGAADPAKPLRIETRFSLLRRETKGQADAGKATPLTAEHRAAFARELRLDEQHMEVTPEIQKAADGVCGGETNPVLMARKIFDFVILKSDHYSKFGPTPKGKCLGDASECMLGAGDCCTDQHALFIAMARARGIPCRLMFGSRLKPENESKDHDPGYRCWPQFFAPGIGWVSLDISSADGAPDGEAGRWFGGLDDRRVEWAEGRGVRLDPAPAGSPDLLIRGYVEVDGQPHKAFTRSLRFTRR